ncbi:heavy-metal-associated domain-containing protein [Rugamonas rivuli]|uniref:Copper chaperone n=1 Tax=Rugamonas rivuli TaxID=2743358 RepID=A0A843SC18_9BURK|nr:heavy-metal-associated domain-containing protein [Rugamonas rivuli]MQA18116.1 copper chaperone [Rugamonas rivuli]
MQTELIIDGMDGEACADIIARVLGDIDGVSDVRVSLRDRRASARIDESLTSPHLLMRKLAMAGYASSAATEAVPVAAPAAAAGGCCGGCCGG